MKLKGIEFYRLKPEQYEELENLREGSIRDMLRYDLAFQSDDDPLLIAFPIWKTPHGNLPGTGGSHRDPSGRVTGGRWRSFSLKLERVTNEDSARYGALWESFQSGLKWTTYRHPRVDHWGKTDYSALAPVKAKVFHDARGREWNDEVTPVVLGRGA